MDDESTVTLLLKPETKKTEPKARKLHQNRAANSLFCGLLLGFIFSFLVAYSGVIEDAQVPKNIDYSLNDLMQRSNFTLEVPKDANLAEYLVREVRLLCFMLPIHKSTLDERGDIFMKTWAKRCTKFIFFSDDDDDRFKDNIVVLNEKSNNWVKLREAYSYIYKHFYNDFDWFLKTNDNTYMVIENLRWLLFQYDTDWPLLIGQRFLAEDYMTGVYVVSKRALSRLVERAFTNKEICSESSGHEDHEVAKCLQHVNVLQIDALDDDGRGMFFQNSPEAALFPERLEDYDKWYWHKLKQGPNKCCSDRLIAIQNVFNTHLYYLEYFIYKVHAFGRHRLPEPLPRKKTLDEVVKEKFK